jgi:hypothetical protein
VSESNYTTMKLETVDACTALPDDKVVEQIRLRHHWINNVLNGWLYKSVMADEAAKLRELLDTRQGVVR